MQIKVLNNDEIFGLIEDRIVDGWILVSGPMNALRNLEFERIQKINEVKL